MSSLEELCRRIERTCSDAARSAGELVAQANRLRALAGEVAAVTAGPDGAHAGRTIIASLEAAHKACAQCGMHLTEMAARPRQTRRTGDVNKIGLFHPSPSAEGYERIGGFVVGTDGVARLDVVSETLRSRLDELCHGVGSRSLGRIVLPTEGATFLGAVVEMCAHSSYWRVVDESHDVQP